MSSPEFYIKSAGAILGPYTSDDVKRMARVGQIRPNQKISKDQTKWHLAGNVPGLFPRQEQQEHSANDSASPKQATVQPAAGHADVPTAQQVDASPVPQSAPMPAAEIPAAVPTAAPLAEAPLTAAPAVPQAAPYPAQPQPAPQVPAAAIPAAAVPLPATPVPAAPQTVSPQVREALIRAIFLIDTGRPDEASDLLRSLMGTGAPGPHAVPQMAAPQMAAPVPAMPAPAWDPHALAEDPYGYGGSCSDTTIEDGEGMDIDVLNEVTSFNFDPSESDIELGQFLNTMSTRQPRRRRR